MIKFKDFIQIYILTTKILRRLPSETSSRLEVKAKPFGLAVVFSFPCSPQFVLFCTPVTFLSRFHREPQFPGNSFCPLLFFFMQLIVIYIYVCSAHVSKK